ncbi:MAG: hypothetical protein Q8859_08465 [Bacteroidota bacterium]|nr:hypothetical protein [Bacteroidota bacterium]
MNIYKFIYERITTYLRNVILIFLASSGILYACNKNEAANKKQPMTPEQQAFLEAKNLLPDYCNLIQYMKSQGYVFWSFSKYAAADKSQLPQKLIVIRHDIHIRDLGLAYAAWFIEKQLIKTPDCATYFVMWGNPEETQDPNVQKEYLNLVDFLKAGKTDVQPHISPIDFYIADSHPSWTYQSKDELNELFKENYLVEKTDAGVNLKVTGKDVLGLEKMNERLPILLKEYNESWEKLTGLKPTLYAAHGTKVAMNYVFNNSVILDQISLIHQGIYKLDTYNTTVFNKLVYLSDNTMPAWMSNPTSIKPGRYQLLMHPKQWEVKAPVQMRTQASTTVPYLIKKR